MTWGEFKQLVEQKGVTDDTPISYIDWADWGGEPCLNIEDMMNGKFAIEDCGGIN